MNQYRKIIYSSAVALPLLAIAATGVHAASTTTDANPIQKFFQNMNLTDAQKAAVEQAQALRKQADDILVKAGLPVHPRMMHEMKRVELTDEQKAALEQAKTLREAGKLDEAKALLEKAGLPVGPMGMKFKHMEWKNGQGAGNVFFNRAVPPPDATK